MTQHTMDTQELDMAGLDVRPKHPQLFHIKEMADQAEIKKKSFQLGPSKHVTYADGINQSNIHDVINILELKLKSKPNLEHNSRIQDAVDKVIEQIRGKIHDTMPGKFKQVGSSRDGTRPGYLAEFDYIYQLEKDVFDIKQDKDDLLAYYLFEPEYVKSNASDIQREFRETIDGIFEEGKVILPQRMSHSGFAGPRFSGVRRNGPATALLLKWSEEDEEDLPFSIDLIVALGIPESMRDDLRDHVNNKLKPVFHDKDETSVFPFGVDNICFVPQSPDKSTWELSTSELEAKLVEKIDDKAPAKRVIKLEKLLAGEPVLTELSPYREEAIPHNVGEMLANVLNGYTSYAESHPQDAEAFRADLKKIMLYAHIFLGQEVAIGLGELSKSSVCLKSYAIKHATLMLAAEKPGSFEQAHNRVYKQLLADVLDEISEQARSRNGEVPHYFLPGRQIRIFSRAAYADDDAAGRTADQIRHNCEMMASKLQRKKGRPGTFDERHDIECPHVKTTRRLELDMAKIQLIQPALIGRNVILQVPKGDKNDTRKLITLWIIKDHLQKRSSGKVVILCTSQNGVWQWLTECQTYLPDISSIGAHQVLNKEKTSFKDIVQEHQILLITYQSLILEMRKNNVSIHGLSVFSLLVFDNCEHAKGKGDPAVNLAEMLNANRVTQKQNTSVNIQQVIGLTDFRGNFTKGAPVCEICANLCTDRIIPILAIKAEEETICLPEHRSLFYNIVLDLIEEIEQSIHKCYQHMSSRSSVPDTTKKFFDVLSACNKDIHKYLGLTGQVTAACNLAVCFSNRMEMRYITSRVEFLQIYTMALNRSVLCSDANAFKYIEREIGVKLKEPIPNDEIDLLTKYKAKQAALESASLQYVSSPHLARLKETVLRLLRKMINIIVTTKHTEDTEFVYEWLKQELEGQVRVGFLLSEPNFEHKRHANSIRNIEEWRLFKSGEYQIIVATGVGAAWPFEESDAVIQYGVHDLMHAMTIVRQTAVDDRNELSQMIPVGVRLSGLAQAL